MRKILMAGAAAAGLMLVAAQANATEFVGSWNLSKLQVTDPGLVVNVVTINPGFDVTLAPNDPSTAANESQATVDLFTLYTNESTLNLKDDFKLSPIELDLTFDLPASDDSNNTFKGKTGGTIVVDGFLDFDQAGNLSWTNNSINFFYGPSNVPKKDQGLLTVSVNGGTFNQGNLFNLDNGPGDGITVSANFDWVRDPAGGVPEPAAWALMIGGFGMSGVMLRRRKAAAATA
jgi:hypothetical protein